MSIVEIEAAIVNLAPTEVDRLLAWLADYREKVWDEQIASDLEAGKLDQLLAEVDAEIEAGIATPLSSTTPCPDSGIATGNYPKKFNGWQTRIIAS